MFNTEPIVQRYRRTDQARLGDWVSVDSTWKTPASSALVVHDIYHHLPTDKGTFAQEVAALGAEWYIDIQPLSGEFKDIGEDTLKSFRRVVSDTVLNALDYSEPDPFQLPLRVVDAASPKEMAFFQQLAGKAHVSIQSSADPRSEQAEDFEARFVQNILWGINQAQARFPDQEAVRRGSQYLSYDLGDLQLSEVPVGHEITITLRGYNSSVDFSDADASFVETYRPEQAVLMLWCSLADRYPVQHATLHTSTSEYLEYVDQHFANQDSADLPEEQKLLPEKDTSGLTTVYIINPQVKTELAGAGSLKISLDALRSAEQSPRGVFVL